MPYNIKQLKIFLAQVERIEKIEWNGGANGDVNDNMITNRKIKVDWKDVFKKKDLKIFWSNITKKKIIYIMYKMIKKRMKK